MSIINEALLSETKGYAELLGSLRTALIKYGKYTRIEAVQMTTALLVATVTDKKRAESSLQETFEMLIKKGKMQ